MYLFRDTETPAMARMSAAQAKYMQREERWPVTRVSITDVFRDTVCAKWPAVPTAPLPDDAVLLPDDDDAVAPAITDTTNTTNTMSAMDDVDGLELQ
jgi:hypothetical protein